MVPRYKVPDSDEEEDDGMALSKNSRSDKNLESGLREAVATIFQKGNLNDLTVKKVRTMAESVMGLEEGYFKGHEEWKSKSDKLIKEEVDKQLNDQDAAGRLDSNKEFSSPPQTKQSPPKQKTSTKRTMTEDHKKSAKRRRTDSSLDDKGLSPQAESRAKEASSSTSTSSKTKFSKASKPKMDLDPKENNTDIHPLRAKDGADSDSESELSVVLDEAPKLERKQNKKLAKSLNQPKAQTGGKADTGPELDQMEMKRLQGWLLKCGIRKVWSRELATFDSPKAKIKHLRRMLEDIGMKGRYSLEKAKKIKEERELQADLELVQEGARRWGTGSRGEGSDDGRPKRQWRARGLQNLDFLSDDGEETD